MAMSQLRHDPLSGRDVIVATARAARPSTFAASTDDRTGVGECPFCPGNEAKTPPEVARLGGGAPDQPGWEVRAIPNLYPIVDVHEVVILAPDHRSFAELHDDEAVGVFSLLRDRVHTYLAAGHLHGVAIINHLKPAGASIAHPHAQVFALDVVPNAVDEAVARVRDAGGDLVRADAADDELVITRAERCHRVVSAGIVVAVPVPRGARRRGAALRHRRRRHHRRGGGQHAPRTRTLAGSAG